MKERNFKRIYDFLDRYVLEKLEYPCNNCGYFECEKNSLNSGEVIRKRYKWNDIDWKRCLKRTKTELDNLMKVLRLPEFRKWSNEECLICKKKFFKHDMKIHSEIEMDGHISKVSPNKKGKYHEWKIFSLCKKCNLSYVHRKKPIYDGFKKLGKNF